MLTLRFKPVYIDPGHVIIGGWVITPVSYDDLLKLGIKDIQTVYSREEVKKLSNWTEIFTERDQFCPSYADLTIE